MAAFDDPNALFDSMMAEANGNQASFQDEDGEFLDAQEHPFEHDAAMEDAIFKLSNNSAFGGGPDEHTYTPSSVDQDLQAEFQSSDQINGHAPGLNDGQCCEAYPSSSSDQNPQTENQGSDQINAPGLNGQQRKSQMTYYSSAAEPAETINVSKQSASEKHTAAYHSIFKKSSTSTPSRSEHTPGCSNTRGASTPPTTPPHQPTSAPQPNSKPEQKIWAGPDDLRDVAKAFQREKRWHEKVAGLRPSFALAPHRYWIGVLNPGLVPRTACKEAHFTWMKGNKYTTVETIRKVYASVTMKEGVFMMGGERPKDEDCVESLDLFNDKIVLFTIAEEGTPAAVGRKITEGLVTSELVELDD